MSHGDQGGKLLGTRPAMSPSHQQPESLRLRCPALRLSHGAAGPWLQQRLGAGVTCHLPGNRKLADITKPLLVTVVTVGWSRYMY